MLHTFFSQLDSLLRFDSTAAHCDIPCKIYDPSTAQIAALSVIRFLDLINELDGTSLSLADQAKLSRLVSEKETHAAKVKDEALCLPAQPAKQLLIVLMVKNY